MNAQSASTHRDSAKLPSIGDFGDKLSHTVEKNPFFSLVAGFLLFSALLYMITAYQVQPYNTRATVQDGVVTMELSPASMSFLPGSEQMIDIVVNTNGAFVDGFQIFADITGSVPNDIRFTPAEITGLNPVVSTIDPITGGVQLKFASITTNPSQSFTSVGEDVVLGTFHFTAPSSGTMNIMFNNNLTTSTSHASAEDILAPVSNEMYSFIGPTIILPSATITPLQDTPTMTSAPSDTPSSPSPTTSTRQARVAGYVNDAQSLAPVSGATITAEDPNAKGRSARVAQTTTDEDGWYEIFVPAGTYNLKSSSKQYQTTAIEDVQLTSTSDVGFDFLMTAKGGRKGPKKPR